MTSPSSFFVNNCCQVGFFLSFFVLISLQIQHLIGSVLTLKLCFASSIHAAPKLLDDYTSATKTRIIRLKPWIKKLTFIWLSILVAITILSIFNRTRDSNQTQFPSYDVWESTDSRCPMTSSMLLESMPPRRIAKRANRLPRNAKRPRMNNKQSRRNRTGVRTAMIPAAYAKTFVKPRGKLRERSSSSVIQSGTDLLPQLPVNTITTSTGEYANLVAVIPCNPIYWNGTRIAAIASAYQNYRPIKIRFRYVPTVPVTQQGAMVFGTLWNTGLATNDVQAALITSNGGLMSPVYKSFTRTIKLGTNLPYNLFNVWGGFDASVHNPFNALMYTLACLDASGKAIVPGQIFVDYTFEFKNPIGQTKEGVTYYNPVGQSGASNALFGLTLGVIKTMAGALLSNIGVIVLDEIKSTVGKTLIGIGKSLLYKRSNFSQQALNDTVSVCVMNGDEVTLPDTTPVICFSNGNPNDEIPNSPVSEMLGNPTYAPQIIYFKYQSGLDIITTKVDFTVSPAAPWMVGHETHFPEPGAEDHIKQYTEDTYTRASNPALDDKLGQISIKITTMWSQEIPTDPSSLQPMGSTIVLTSVRDASNNPIQATFSFDGVNYGTSITVSGQAILPYLRTIHTRPINYDGQYIAFNESGTIQVLDELQISEYESDVQRLCFDKSENNVNRLAQYIVLEAAATHILYPMKFSPTALSAEQATILRLSNITNQQINDLLNSMRSAFISFQKPP